MSGIGVRLANAADVEALSRLHESCFVPSEHIGAAFGKRFLREYYSWHVQDRRAYLIVAEREGHIVGFLGMCEVPFTRPLMRATAGTLVLAVLQRPRRAFEKSLWARFLRSEATSDWARRFAAEPGVAQMTIGAVHEKARGHAVFPSLIAESEKTSRDRGARAIRAGVYRRNVPCRRAFEKRGWVEVPDLSSADTVNFVIVLSDELRSAFPELPATGLGAMARSEDLRPR
ncbi:GNAT family N-acetyltransferase [bacterium]|nr:GNAT family N-acetyltransferase [bacterium]